MAIDLNHLRASDGTGEAVLAHIQSVRTIGSTVLDLDNVDNWNSKAIIVTGTPAANGYIAPAGMTVMYGHVTAGDFIIDGFAPGYSDNGNTTNQIAIVKMCTQWTDALVDILKIALNDDGSLKRAAIDTAAQTVVGLLANRKFYTYSGGNILINGISQANGSNAITWTKPAGLKYVIVTAVGAGGGGGGSGTNAARGGGGGGGGVSIKKIMAADLAATVSVQVGIGGNGGAAGNNAGQAGTNSFFGTAPFGGGGLGGQPANGSFSYDGGSASGGDINLDGQTGVGRRSSATSLGLGGAPSLGFGFPDPITSDQNTEEPGRDGLGYGAGGGGAYRVSANVNGGKGSNGLVIIEEYF